VFKKTASILIILMLIFNSFGYVLLYIQLKSVFKKQGFEKISNYLQDEELIFITDSKSNPNPDIIWIKGHEFKLHGKMYDVFSKVEKGDTIIYKVICDDNENALEHAYNIFFSASTDTTKNTGPIASIIKNFFYIGLTPEANDIRIEIKYNIINIIADTFYSSLYSDIPEPPPKKLI